MDYERKEYASKGVAGAGLGLGIAGTALALGAFGGFGRGGHGLFGGGCHDGGHGPHRGDVDRFELGQSERIAMLEAKNAMLVSERFTLEKVACVERQITELSVRHALLDQRQRDFEECTERRLNAITRTVVPASVICPPVAPAAAA